VTWKLLRETKQTPWTGGQEKCSCSPYLVAEIHRGIEQGEKIGELGVGHVWKTESVGTKNHVKFYVYFLTSFFVMDGGIG
jgi:hypothetical protein